MKHRHLNPRGTSGLFAVMACVLMLVPLGADAARGERSLDGVWTDQGDQQQLSLGVSNRDLMPEAYHVFTLDKTSLDGILDRAPLEKNAPARDGVILSFPMPDGTFARFSVVESPILVGEAADALPDMRTYLAQGVDDPTATLRFDVGYWGFRAYGRTAQGTLWIDPWELGDRTNYLSAWKRDFPGDPEAFDCEILEDVPALDLGDRAIPSSGDELFTYRLVLTLTGEYCGFLGGIPQGQSAAITTINRLNAVYEVEAAVRYSIVGWLAWDDPAMDPFPTGSAVNSALLSQNQQTVNGSFADDEYDVGHLFTQGGNGGLAAIGSVCSSSYQANAATSRANPAGDPFGVDYVAHEMGHQMGARHTFNGSTSSCNGNRTASTAYEPGSGSTIMAYAGICGAENVQSAYDAYFHVRSLEQIISHRNLTGCAAVTSTGNTPPVADAGSDVTIPRNTPFYVNGAGTDADGDALTYCWEQYDLGAASPPTDPLGPLFRSFSPSDANFRYFPDNAQVLAGTNDPWELTPTVDRSLTLRLTVRDNVAGGGGVDDDELEITVAGAPFEVLSPNGGESFTAGQPVSVTWNVGGSVHDMVTIYLLADGFSTLANGVPNDGEQLVTLPCGVTSANCRIWVQAMQSGGAQYYDVSDAAFSLTDGLPNFGPYTPAGWGDSIVASDQADLDSGSAPLPTTLVGDAVSYFGHTYGNYGDAWSCGDFVSSFRIDERVTIDRTAQPDPLTIRLYWNFSDAVSGGRHTVWQHSDPDGLIPEYNEDNNAYARQWVWAPQVLPQGEQHLRAAPPQRFAGTEHLADGVPVLANRDGMRIPVASGYWRVMGVSNPDPSHDYDIALYSPSSGVEAGFDNGQLANSAAGGNATDAVISNRNTVGNPVYDVGVLNWNGAGTDYRLESRESVGVLEVNDTFSRSVAEFQALHVEELYVDVSQLGSVSVVVSNLTADQPVTMRLYNPDFTEGGLYSSAAAVTSAAGDDRLVLTFDATESDFHGLVIHRTASAGTAPFSFDITLLQTPADLAAVTLPGSHAPLIPRNDTDIAVGDPVPADDQLDGDTLNTIMYYHLANLGPVASTPFQLAMEFDGVLVNEFDSPFPAELQGDPSVIWSQGRGAFTVRGGRHTAGLIIDSQNTNAEIYEDNNRYGEQWVWRPTQLAPESAVARVTPPLRDGGWGDVAAGTTLYDNVDGLRSQTFEIEDDDTGYWGGVAILPTDDADLDLRLHAPTTGPMNGFDTIIEQSVWGGSSSDFVLIDFDGAQPTGNAWDAGVVRHDDESGYALQSVRSTYLNDEGLVFPSTFGAFTVPAGQVMGLYEFGTYLDGSGGDITFRIDVRQLSGGADLGLSVFVRDDAEGFYSKAEAAFASDAGGDGANEQLEITVPEGAYVGLAVWKVDHTDLPLDATFEIKFLDPTLVSVPEEGELPDVTRIESVYPNPFNPQTTVRLAMSRPGRASVKVYNLQGRLVRTLVDADLAAGRHELPWSGLDNAGRSVPSGVYFVRAVHPDGIDRQRMSLVK